MPIRELSWTGVRFSVPPPQETPLVATALPAVFYCEPHRRIELRAGCGAEETRERFPAKHARGTPPQETPLVATALPAVFYCEPHRRIELRAGCGAEETRERFPAKHARGKAPQRVRVREAKARILRASTTRDTAGSDHATSGFSCEPHRKPGSARR